MNKIRKSETDIKKEVIKILNNANNNIDTIINNINSYFNNLTGKELIRVISIKNIFLNEIEKNKPELLRNKKFINECNVLNPVLKFYINNKRKGFLKSVNINYISADLILTELIHKDNIKWNKYKNSDIPEILRNEKELKNFYDYLTKNPAITNLLIECIYNENEIIFNWIRAGKIPLNTINYFFNNKKDIKENTEYFYNKLNKKIPRIKIQKEILKELNKN